MSSNNQILLGKPVPDHSQLVSTFVVMGRPVPKARPRIGGKGRQAYTPRKTLEYEHKVQAAWHLQSGRKMTPGHPLRATITVWYAVPESYSNGKRLGALSLGGWYTHRPDLDNIVKAILDALNGYCFTDDALVCDLYANKRYTQDNNERVEVTIGEIW